MLGSNFDEAKKQILEDIRQKMKKSLAFVQVDDYVTGLQDILKESIDLKINE